MAADMSESRSPGPSEHRAAVQWAWARVLLDGFAEAGVRDVVISPGSRSTPFVLAAHRHPKLRCHDVLDERSAAFFALGQSKACGEPSLLVCTSGTAGAHYLPAVMEASLSHTPLLLLTADRPFELQACGANQTADQLKLFGSHARGFFHLGRPDGSERALRAVRRTAAQAAALARAPLPGPVHLNAPAHQPLEPPAEGEDPAHASSQDRPEPLGERLIGTPVTRVAAAEAVPSPEAVREVAERLSAAARPLFVCGPQPPARAGAVAALRRLAASRGIPLAAEATSQLRFGPESGGGAGEGSVFGCFDPIYRSPAGRERLRPDLIVQFGGTPASGGLLALLADASDSSDREEVGRIVVAPHGWPDPESAADLLVRADSGRLAAALDAALDGTAGEAAARRGAVTDASRRSWLEAVGRADGLARRAIEAELERAGDRLTEGAVAQAVPRAMPQDGLLAVGNSLPVRQLDAWSRPGPGPGRVLSQRGLSGIDGLVSGAAGACARSGRPTVLLVGDVSFLHDLSGLLAARSLEPPFVVVVVNNDGGRLFEELPIGGRSDLEEALPHFTTPHGVALEHAAALFGHRHAVVDTVTGFDTALGEALSQSGCTVVEARVPPHGAAEQNGRVREAVREALAAL